MTPHNFLRSLAKIRNPKTILNGKESVYFPVLPSYFFSALIALLWSI